MENLERLQKIIAHAGVASRRAAEELIRAGRITVNGHTVRELGAKADPEHDHIKVDGKRLPPRPRPIYLLLNKPRQVISTLRDPQGRMKVTDLVDIRERVYPVGRLDYSTEGLILLTNDGEFARTVSRAGEAIAKVYQAKVRSAPDERALQKLREGLRLHDGTQYAECKIRRLREGNNSWFEVILTQGRNQQIRRMFEAVGHPIMKLRRVAIGFLTDRGLPVGRYRHLNEIEIQRLRRLSERRPPSDPLPKVR